MRIHTRLTSAQLHEALREDKALGRIGQTVYLDDEPHGSRKNLRAFEIRLTAMSHDSEDGKRRFTNSGGYGRGDELAATYDEWGWFLTRLYALDDTLITPYYDDAEDLAFRTAWTYLPELLIAAIEAGGDPFPFVRKPQAKLKRGFVSGRRGAARTANPQWGTYRPRTVEEVRAYAYPKEAQMEMLADFAGIDECDYCDNPATGTHEGEAVCNEHAPEVIPESEQCDECNERALNFWKLPEPVKLCDSCEHNARRSGWEPGL